MGRVRKTREPLLIKRGQTMPPPATDGKPWLLLRGTVKIEGDIVGPTVMEKGSPKRIARTGESRSKDTPR